MQKIPAFLLTSCLVAASALAQGAVKVDPKHYKVEFENAEVRVLRVTYGPHETSVIHDHPANVAVWLTDEHGKFTLPDRKTQETHKKAGETAWGPAEPARELSHKPLVLVELKGK